MYVHATISLWLSRTLRAVNMCGIRVESARAKKKTGDSLNVALSTHQTTAVCLAESDIPEIVYEAECRLRVNKLMSTTLTALRDEMAMSLHQGNLIAGDITLTH